MNEPTSSSIPVGSLLPSAAAGPLFCEWERLGEKLRDPFFRRLHEDNLGALEMLRLHSNPADLSDVPAHFDKPDVRRFRGSVRPFRYRIERNAVAWHLTKEARYLDEALQTVEAVCDSPRWEPNPASFTFPMDADLGTGEMMFDLVFALDSLGPQMLPALRERVVETLVTRGLGAYLRGIENRNWWIECDFNWNSALHGNAGLAALALRDSHPELSQHVLRETLRGLPFMIAAFPEGGGWIEGVMYADTAIGHLLDFVAPYHHLTGDDLGLLSNEKFHDTIAFLAYMRAGDGHPFNFSDCNEPTREWGLAQHFWVADKLGRPDLAWPAEHRQRNPMATHGIFQNVEAFWFRQPFQEAKEPDVRGLKHFRGIDWLTWHGERTWLAFRSGFCGGNHDNLDLGHFILGRGGDRFLCDPGYGMVKTSQHNAVTVRNHEQCDGATARILSAETLEPGRGMRLECDLREAFPHVLDRHRRHLVLIDDLHLLVVDDLACLPHMRNGARWHLQTRLPVEHEGENVIIRGKEGQLRVLRLTDPGPLHLTEWEHVGAVTTISWKMKYDRVHSQHAMLLTFADAPPEAVAEVEGERLRVRVAGREWVFGEA
jgi:hypothetical protein